MSETFEIHETLAYYVTHLYKDFLAHTSEQLQTLGLNFGSLPFIIYVGKNPGCTTADLINDLHMDWGYAQRSITKLVQDSFMTKEKQIKGTRAYNLNLTAKGKEAFETSHEVFFSWDNAQMIDLNEDERVHLLEMLKNIHMKKRIR